MPKNRVKLVFGKENDKLNSTTINDIYISSIKKRCFDYIHMQTEPVLKQSMQLDKYYELSQNKYTRS